MRTVDTEVSTFVYERTYCKRAGEREKDYSDVMFVYLKIDFFASMSQWSSQFALCLL